MTSQHAQYVFFGTVCKALLRPPSAVCYVASLHAPALPSDSIVRRVTTSAVLLQVGANRATAKSMVS
jgi:hypothetical protein